MKLTINDRRKIVAIQSEFNKLFPFLRLEFFAKPNKGNESLSTNLVPAEGITIRECRSVHQTGALTITPNMTVHQLEQLFDDVFGLRVNILRRSGKAWLETSRTNGWTLNEQNKQGMELSVNKTNP